MRDIWKSWGVSVTGARHIKENLPNQDSLLFKKFKNGSIAVVSDGLGSKPFSDIGSKAACKSVIEAGLLYRKHKECNYKVLSMLIHAFWILKLGILKPSECSATCLFAMQIKNSIILGRLGDGMIIASGKEKFIVMEDNEKEDFLSNFTDCLGNSYSEEKWEVKMIPADKIDSIILCTDGVSNGINSEKIHEFSQGIYECYKKMKNKKRLKEISKWLEEWPVSDDKTLACLYREK